MRIKSDYIPRAQQRAARTATALCPNCGQQIPVAELDAHLRIELLDPRWKEQQAGGQQGKDGGDLKSAHGPPQY